MISKTDKLTKNPILIDKKTTTTTKKGLRTKGLVAPLTCFEINSLIISRKSLLCKAEFVDSNITVVTK